MKMKWLAKWGGRWYDRSIRANKLLNRLLVKLGWRPRQISKAIKDGVKRIVNKKTNWEGIAANAAINAGHDLVVVGHIHKPEIREIETPNGTVMYLNSGDWLENLTSLEFHEGRWKLFTYEKDMSESALKAPVPATEDYTDAWAFAMMLKEFGLEAQPTNA
jgi:UDP-2,3-diacylglucosamine pyrophosphatase LpxH